MAIVRNTERILNRKRYLEDRIDNMIRSKLIYLTNSLNEMLQERHTSAFPELTAEVILKTIRDIRMYRLLAVKINPLLIDEAEMLTKVRL